MNWTEFFFKLSGSPKNLKNNLKPVLNEATTYNPSLKKFSNWFKSITVSANEWAVSSKAPAGIGCYGIRSCDLAGLILYASVICYFFVRK
jgi:hypothetical protein